MHPMVVGSSDALASVHPMVPEVAAEVSEKPTASSERSVTGRTDALCTECSDAYAETG